MSQNLIGVKVYRGNVKISGAEPGLVLLFNLGVALHVSVQGRPRLLGREDVMVIHEKTSFTVSGSDALCVQYTLDKTQFAACFPHKNYRFLCDSTQEVNDNYALLRRILTGILRVYYEHHAYMEAEIGRLYYELVIFLVNNFAVEEAAAPSSRAEQMMNYIEQHYQEPLSLAQISEDFHMSPPYFSKEFKAQIGQNFYKYLNHVRIHYAAQELETTGKTLLRIALDNGFPNMESFHRYFVEICGRPPLAWREERQKANVIAKEESRHAVKEALRQLGSVSTREQQETEELAIDTTHRQPYHPYWREMLHLGDAALLDNSVIAQQLHRVLETLRFRFVRIRVDERRYDPAKEYSFYEEERRLDYLMDQNLQVWLYVDYRLVMDWERLYSYLDKLFSHFANRYSIGNIKKWRLELIYNTIFDDVKANAYMLCYNRLQTILRKYGCEQPLLGAGLSLGTPGSLENLYAWLERQRVQLPNQTFEAEPYLYFESLDGPTISRATDSSYLKNKLLTIRQHLPYFRDVVKNVYITNWADSTLKTNAMNDACYKGANLLKTLIDCFGQVQGMTHDVPLDAIYTSNLQGDILFGGNGLLSKHGIPKPSYYAYQFLNRVGDYYLCRNERAIVFADVQGNYQVLCHNCKRLNYKYYLSEENLDPGDLDQYFEDREPLTLRFCLTGLQNGRYVIKQRTISQAGGSVRDHLLEMGAGNGIYVHSNDLEYLRQVSVPRIQLEERRVTDGSLKLEVTLPANAFAYLHIIYQF